MRGWGPRAITFVRVNALRAVKVASLAGLCHRCRAILMSGASRSRGSGTGLRCSRRSPAKFRANKVTPLLSGRSNLRTGRALMHGVAPQMCGQVSLSPVRRRSRGSLPRRPLLALGKKWRRTGRPVAEPKQWLKSTARGRAAHQGPRPAYCGQRREPTGAG